MKQYEPCIQNNNNNNNNKKDKNEKTKKQKKSKKKKKKGRVRESVKREKKILNFFSLLFSLRSTEIGL